MTDNPQQPPQPGDPHRPPYPQQPYGQQPPGQQPPGREPHGHPPYGEQPSGPSHRPPGEEPPYGRPGETLGDPTAFPGNEVPPDRSVHHLPPTSDGGFFGALFDFSFSRYITPTVVKVVYVVVIVVTALYWLGGLIASFAQDWWVGLLFLLFGWIFALLYLAFVRIVLECFVALISISQKVNAYAHRDGVS